MIRLIEAPFGRSSKQAIAEQFKGLSLFEVGQSREKGLKVGRFVKDALAVVTAIDHMIDQAIVDGTQGSGHPAQRSWCGGSRQLK